RELTEVMKGILPDNDDVNNLVRTLQTFCDETGLRTTNLKKKNEGGREKTEFDKVGYTLLLKFLDRVETHSRFMRVPNFQVSSNSRGASDKNGTTAHRVQVDVETFVYDPQKDG